MSKKFLLFIFFSILLSAAVVNTFAQEKKQNPPASPIAEMKTSAVSYGIVVDNSGSFRLLLDGVVKIVHDIVEENKPDDETFLVRFVDSSKIDLLQDFTASKDEIHAAAEEMFVEGGKTAILDAVSFAVKHTAENAKGDAGKRRCLILISDGDDRASGAKIEDVLKLLKDEKIRVFTVGIADGKISSKILNRLAKETGGKSFEPKTRAEISVVVKELAAAMRAAQ